LPLRGAIECFVDNYSDLYTLIPGGEILFVNNTITELNDFAKCK
jgi:hypothetical protein